MDAGGPRGLSNAPATDGILQGGEIRDMVAGDVNGDGAGELIEANLRVDDHSSSELQVYGGGRTMTPTRIATWPWQTNPFYGALLARWVAPAT
jgi:hypothetical protein